MSVFEVFQVATTIFIRIMTTRTGVDFATVLSLLPFLLTGSGDLSGCGFLCSRATVIIGVALGLLLWLGSFFWLHNFGYFTYVLLLIGFFDLFLLCLFLFLVFILLWFLLLSVIILLLPMRYCR